MLDNNRRARCIRKFLVTVHPSKSCGKPTFPTCNFGFCLVVIAAFTAKAEGEAFVIPHILEKQGSINNPQITFDTQFFVTYPGGIDNNDPTPGASVFQTGYG